MKKKKTSNEIGKAWEKDFAESIGATLQPLSGAGWYARMDAKGLAVLWSLKSSESDEPYRIKLPDSFAEVYEAARAPGGEYLIPGLAIRIRGAEFVTLRLGDFLELIREENNTEQVKKIGRTVRTYPTRLSRRQDGDH